MRGVAIIRLRIQHGVRADRSRVRLDDVKEGDLKLGVRLALFHEELVGLLSQPLVHAERIYQRCLYLSNGLLHLCCM